jgi:hypothetical protein
MESDDSGSSSAGVRRHCSPPPIHGTPGSLEWSDEEDDDVESLRRKLTMLRIRLNNMDERVVETQIESMDVEDKMEILRKALVSKMKRLYRATDNMHLYKAENKK